MNEALEARHAKCVLEDRCLQVSKARRASLQTGEVRRVVEQLVLPAGDAAARARRINKRVRRLQEVKVTLKSA